MSRRRRRTRDELEEAHGASPFSEFPAARRDEILAAVAAPRPPEPTIGFLRSATAKPLATMPSRAWYEWHWARGIDPDAKRERIDGWTRQQVIDRDGYVCGLCGGAVEPADVHIDHIVPWSLGGRDELTNLQVAHSKCNLRKGNRV